MSYFTVGTPWQVAAVRAVLTGALLGAAGFLTMWSQTEDTRQLIIAFFTPFVGTLLIRLGVEGTIDSRKP